MSLKQTAICVLDEDGEVVWRGSKLTSVALLPFGGFGPTAEDNNSIGTGSIGSLVHARGGSQSGPVTGD